MHGNCYSLATKVPDISLLVKHMIENSLFQKQLGRTGLRNNRTEYAYRDLFAEGVACISTDVLVDTYRLLVETAITTIWTTWLILTTKMRMIRTEIWEKGLQRIRMSFMAFTIKTTIYVLS